MAGDNRERCQDTRLGQYSYLAHDRLFKFMANTNRSSKNRNRDYKISIFENLYSEIGWDTLEARRKKQKLTLFYTPNTKILLCRRVTNSNISTRLRTKSSSLNYDIFLRNLNDSPFCRCGSIENTEHYLLQCRLYQQSRVEMPNSVSQLCHVTLDVLLSGDSSFSIDINSKIFSIVQKFIKDSKRFQQHLV